MRRQFEIKSWIKSAINEEENEPNGRMWKNEPSKDDIYNERLKRIKFLRKHGAINPQAGAVAQRLGGCEFGDRCLSGACPECGRLLQRWFVQQARTFIRKHLEGEHTELAAVTIVPAYPIVRPGKLASFSIVDLQRRLKYALDKVDIAAAIGGIDFSFNEDQNGKYKPFWSPHVYVITAAHDRKQLQRELRKHYESKIRIPRPVQLSRFHNRAYRRSYVLKMNFRRRIGYDENMIRKDGAISEGRNTRSDKLRVVERLELFIYLDQIGLAERIIFWQAKPIIDSFGVRIERVGSRRIKRLR